jgi:hypothetical protein
MVLPVSVLVGKEIARLRLEPCMVLARADATYILSRKAPSQPFCPDCILTHTM